MSPVPQPPFPAELLADLHAGNIDPELEARLWPAVRQDPDARRYLESLDAMRRSLTGLAESDRVVRPMPADIAARLEAFAESLGNAAAREDGTDTAETAAATVPLGNPPAPTLISGNGTADSRRSRPAAESDGAGPISLDAHRWRRRLAAPVAAAATVLICAGAALFVGIRSDGETAPTAAPTGTAGTELGAGLDTAVALHALGRHDVPGRLSDPAARTACVRAAGVDRPVLGSTEIRFRERDDAVLILVGGRNGAQVTALVVGPGCGPGNPELLAPITDIG